MALRDGRPATRATGISAAGERSVRLIPAGSPQWVILRVLREALDPEWAPASAAAGLVDRVPDPFVVRRARADLRKATSTRTSVRGARAVATLNLAISRLEDDNRSGMRPRR